MNISSLQKRVAKSFAFDVDTSCLIESINQLTSGNVDDVEFSKLVGCKVEQVSVIKEMPQSVIVIHSLDRFYAKQDVVKSVFSDSSESLKEEFFNEYMRMLSIYKETVELIGLNASIEQVLELSSSTVFKRRDWPKIRYIFSKEIENIYYSHQEKKKQKLNKSEGEIQLEWNEHIKHSKGRKLSIADKVRIQSVMKANNIDVSQLDRGDILIKIAREALVDIVQINQIF
ncbi:hypothetical protein [Vibrio mediterranei]|uniref:hypothetical protein n=1 Tax=Vibrio mediterranei TaxID=689 RepID=UPI004067644B